MPPNERDPQDLKYPIQRIAILLITVAISASLTILLSRVWGYSIGFAITWGLAGYTERKYPL